MHLHRCAIRARGCLALVPCESPGCDTIGGAACNPCQEHTVLNGIHPHHLGECLTDDDLATISKDGP